MVEVRTASVRVIRYLMPRTKAALLEWRDHLKIMRHRGRILAPKPDFVFSKIDRKAIKRFDKA